MELSELVTFNNRLLSFDDKTGIVFEIIDGKVKPWIILTDGEKGFKSEWATVKNHFLYVGSTGSPWISKNGSVLNENSLVMQVCKTGKVKTLNWYNNYAALRKASGFEFPGFVLHESGIWSKIHKKWFFLPRFCSKEELSKDKEKSPGCNLLMTADEKFEDIKIVDIPLSGEYRKVQGFSSFQFVPGSNDTIIVALKTTETDLVMNTFVCVFDIYGYNIYGKIDVFLDKYEGIEFI